MDHILITLFKKYEDVNLRKQIGEFRLSIIREGLREFPGLDPMDALQMMEEMGF